MCVSVLVFTGVSVSVGIVQAHPIYVTSAPGLCSSPPLPVSSASLCPQPLGSQCAPNLYA